VAGYDERLGGGYAAQRRPDPRIAAQIRDALVVLARHRVRARPAGDRPAALPGDPRRSGAGAGRVFAKTSPDHVAEGLARLQRDLRRGAWAERHQDLLARDEMDVGYRLLVSG